MSGIPAPGQPFTAAASTWRRVETDCLRPMLQSANCRLKSNKRKESRRKAGDRAMEENEIMTPEASSPKKKKKIAVIIAIIVALLVVLFGGLFLFRHYSNRDPLEESVKAKLGQLENKSNDEIEAALNEVIEEGSIRVSINMNPVFPTGDVEGSLQIENHPNNHYDLRCIITADTNEDGEDEELYDSELMPVNSHIQQDKLEVDLDKGEYDATATFTAYDTETEAEVGQVVAQIRISVLN